MVMKMWLFDNLNYKYMYVQGAPELNIKLEHS